MHKSDGSYQLIVILPYTVHHNPCTYSQDFSFICKQRKLNNTMYFLSSNSNEYLAKDGNENGRHRII